MTMKTDRQGISVLSLTMHNERFRGRYVAVEG